MGAALSAPVINDCSTGAPPPGLAVGMGCPRSHSNACADRLKSHLDISAGSVCVPTTAHRHRRFASPPCAADVEDPPAFTKSQHTASLPDGFKSAIRKHYAHLAPLKMPGGDPAACFAAAKKAAAVLPNATVVYEDAAAGALELLDVTPLMKFKDDVAVR